MRVELRGVSRRFGGIHALRRIDLVLQSGAKVALIGPNGSGKSTLTRVLMGLIHHQGDVLLDGRPAHAHRLDLARQIAYVPQIAPQIAAPVSELLAAICRLRAIDLNPIRDLADALGLDLETIKQQSFRRLSGGTKQKLLIALTLASPVSMLILDEPTASLDAHARDCFYGLYRRRAADSTVLLCSHRIDEVRHLVDHVVALHEGQLVYDGPAEQYLDRRVTSLIELHVPQDADVRTKLQAFGFEPSISGWWLRRVTRCEKLALLHRLPIEIGPALRNVVARDLDAIDLQGPPS